MSMRGAIEGQRQHGDDSARTIALSEFLGEALARHLGVAETHPPPSPYVPRTRPNVPRARPIADRPPAANLTGPDSGRVFRTFRNLIYLAAALYAGYLIAKDIYDPEHDPTFAGPSEFADLSGRQPESAMEGTGARCLKGAEFFLCSARRQERVS